MVINREGNDIVIRISDKINPENLQRLIDYLIYNEQTINSEANQEEIDKLSSEINRDWWTKNKDRFLKP